MIRVASTLGRWRRHTRANAFVAMFGTATALTIAATYARGLLNPWLDAAAPYSFFLLATGIAATTGWRTGLLTLVMGGAVGFLYLPGHLDPPAPFLIEFAGYAVVGMLIVLLAEFGQRQRAAAEEEAKMARESEERFRVAMDASGTGWWYWDFSASVIDGDAKVKALVGITPTEALSFEQLLAQTNVNDCQQLAERVAKMKTVAGDYEIEFRTVWRDGSEHWLLAKGRSFNDGKPSPQRARGIATDVTAQRQVERTLRENEKRLKAVVDNLTEGLIVLDAVGGVVHWNRAALEMLADALEGERIDELNFLERDRFELQTPGGEPISYENWPIPRLLRGEAFRNFEFMITKGTLAGRVFSCHGTPVCDERGGMTLGLLTIADITDRKRVEQALRESEEKFRTLAEGAHAAIGIVQGTRFVYANRYFIEHSGYTVEELLKTEFVALVAPEFRAMMIERAQRRQAGLPVPNHYEFKMILKNGEQRWIDFSPAAIEYKGKPAIIGTGFDITDRKKAEAELHEAKELAEEASRAKDHFLAMLSHELRAPLTPVLAAISLLKRSPPRSEQPRLLEAIGRNVALEARLIDDLLDLTRIARGKIRFDMQPLDFREVLESALQTCQTEIESRDLELREMIEPGPYPAKGDFSRLQQVFWNLLNNAVKYTPRGGTIAIRCARKGERAIAEVRDSGVGFEPHDADRIFMAFEQAHNMKLGGLGLGLAICKRFVEMHGGKISAFSAGKGRGASFRVELPLMKASEVTSEAAGGRRALEHDEDHLRILIVEDDYDTAFLLRLALSTGDRKVQIAKDAGEALRVTAAEPFDLIISDLGLPDRNGLELIRDIRAAGHNTKAIALSGYGQEEDVRRSLEAGFAKHITKPVDVDALEMIVRESVDSA